MLKSYLPCTLIVLALGFLASPPVSFGQGTDKGSLKKVNQLYRAGRYKQALEETKKLPESDLKHYYAGLSYHGLNQTSMASNEYSWVMNYSRNPRLRRNAGNALKTVSSYSQSRTYQGNGNVYARYSAPPPPKPKPKQVTRTSGG